MSHRQWNLQENDPTSNQEQDPAYAGSSSPPYNVHEGGSRLYLANTEYYNYAEASSGESSNRTYSSTSHWQAPPTAEMTPHVWIERSNTTSGQALSHLIVEISRDGVTSYFCGWEGCRYPVGFAKRTQLITHIRSVHLQEKPFLCTTCNAVFERKQDAIRHVASMNSRQYRCSGCDRIFSRKQHRDAHEESCLSRES